MKCNEFEFEYIAAPDEIAGDACEHLQGCVICKAFVAEQAVFEKQLADAVCCDVPDGFRHSIREHVVNRQSSFWSLPKSSLALVASLFMAIGLVSTYQFVSQPAFPIDRLIVEHLDHDGVRSMKASHQLTPQELANVAEGFGVRVKPSSRASFAEKCPIGKSFGLHMVYQYKGQPITVIYMPEMAPEKTIPFQYAGLKGWVKPLKVGSIAVLAGVTIELPAEEFAGQSIEWL